MTKVCMQYSVEGKFVNFAYKKLLLKKRLASRWIYHNVVHCCKLSQSTEFTKLLSHQLSCDIVTNNVNVQSYKINFIIIQVIDQYTYLTAYVTGPAKVEYIGANCTCSENGTFVDLCL